jgi:hypothetical protein
LDFETLRQESETAGVTESQDPIQDLDLIPLAIHCDQAIFGGTTERNGAHLFPTWNGF